MPLPAAYCTLVSLCDDGGRDIRGVNGGELVMVEMLVMMVIDDVGNR